jgi:hypothetical protein
MIKVRLPQAVYDGLEAVRLSGKANMLDVMMVIKYAFEMGHTEAGFWVCENTRKYVECIFCGVEPEEGGEVGCAD